MNVASNALNSSGLQAVPGVLVKEVEGVQHVQHAFLISPDLSLQMVCFTVLVSACSIFGTVGNIPVLLVYCQRTDTRTANTFIRVLAVVDLLVCAIVMPYTIVYELHLVTSDLVCRAVELLRHVTITSSNLTLVAIAVERYVAVCVLRHRLTVQNVNHGMVAVAVVAAVMSLPSVAVFAVVRQEDVQDLPCSLPHHFPHNYTFCHFTTTILGPVLSRSYQAGLMLFFLISFLLIVVFYALVYASLWKRSRRRARNSAQVSLAEKKQQSSLPFREQLQDQTKACRQDVENLLDAGNEVSECLMSEQPSCQHAVCDCKLSACGCKLSDKTDSFCPGVRLTRGNRKQSQLYTRTARMLFLCSVVFLVTWLPFWVDIFGFTHNLCLRYLFFVGNASNPLVYGLANSHFRRSLVKIFSRYKFLWCTTFRNELK